MSYKIICDSCTDLTKEEKKDSHVHMIPLILSVGDKEYIDDETFSQADFIADMEAFSDAPKSSCPSSGTYLDAIENADADMVFIITLSKELSGSYQSAEIAKQMFEEENEDSKTNIYVINSKSASVGQALIAKRIQKLYEAGKSFNDICSDISAYVDEMTTYFVLESLDNLKKNGRLSKIQAIFASALNIKPVMGSQDGNIIKLAQARGMKKALEKMVEIIAETTKNQANKVIGIAHCNNVAGAEFVREVVLRLCHFKEIYITETSGVATLYAANGGIVVSV